MASEIEQEKRETLADIVIVHQVGKYILNIVNLRPLLKHPAESIILFVYNMLAENIAIQGIRSVIRGHPLYLYTWTVKQYSIQTAILARNIHSGFIRISTICHIYNLNVTYCIAGHSPNNTTLCTFCKYTKIFRQIALIDIFFLTYTINASTARCKSV